MERHSPSVDNGWSDLVKGNPSGERCLCRQKTVGRDGQSSPWGKLPQSAPNLQNKAIIVALVVTPASKTQYCSTNHYHSCPVKAICYLASCWQSNKCCKGYRLIVRAKTSVTNDQQGQEVTNHVEAAINSAAALDLDRHPCLSRTNAGKFLLPSFFIFCDLTFCCCAEKVTIHSKRQADETARMLVLHNINSLRLMQKQLVVKLHKTLNTNSFWL